MKAFRGGSVLIVMLWVCFGLVGLTLTFGHSMLIHFRGTDNRLSARQADHAIDGAIRYAKALLAQPETPGELPRPDLYVAAAVPVGEEARFWFIGRPENAARDDQPAFGLIDEASKLNLNSASVEMLEMLPGMTPDLAAAIVEWREPEEGGVMGAIGSLAYLSRTPPYHNKNGPFESVEELALVDGADLEILFGSDLNRNGVRDAGDGETSGSWFEPGILEYVTVHSREPNLRADGSPRFNVNQRTNEFRDFLAEALDEGRAEEVISQLGRGRRIFSLLEFYVRSGLTEEEFDRIAGELTVRDGDFLTGLINVNTASEAVLACVPGIGVEYAGALVGERNRRNDPGLAWVAEVLDEQALRLAGPHLTGNSWQATADIAAVGRHGRGYRRTRVVIDYSDQMAGPQVVYRRDLGHLGWALGEEVWHEMAENGGNLRWR